jgi:ABC-2 type transport system permease protein
VERLQSIVQLGAKELASLARDTALIGLIFYAFTYAVFGPAKGASMELRNASVAIVDEDRSALSARIVDALLPPYFITPRYITADQVDTLMDAGRFTFVIDFPPRFQAEVQAGHHPTMQVEIDATAMTQAGRGAGYIQTVATREIESFLDLPAVSQPVRLVTRARFNPNLLDTWFVGMAQLINNLTMLAIFLSGAAVVREREHGTLEHLLVMPLRPSEIMLAKVWSNSLVIVTASVVSLWVVVRGVLHVPVAGSVTLFAAGATIYLFATTSLGILLATMTRSMPQFGLLAFLVFLVLNMLSGGTTPLDSMPSWLQNVLALSPTTHFVNFALAILYRGAGLDAVWSEFLIVAGIGVVCFAVALTRFRRMIVLAGAV